MPKIKRHPRLNKNKKQLCIEMPMKLVILSLLTNVLSIYQVNCHQVMGKNSPTINFMVAQLFMILLGLRKTLMAKECFEQWLQLLAAAGICHLHCDYGIFNVELFV